jgi:heme-degrading monooxygenase HmoA
MPYGRCVIYSIKSGDGQEIIEKARASLLPIYRQQPGFIAYGSILRDRKIASVSAWDSEADADAANEAILKWVSENLDIAVDDRVMGEFALVEFAEGRRP